MAGVFTLLDCLELGSYTEMIFPLIRSVMLCFVFFDLIDAWRWWSGCLGVARSFLLFVLAALVRSFPCCILGSTLLCPFPSIILLVKNIIRIIHQHNMRYEDWDILLFYGDGEQRKPLREFRPQCNTTSETEESLCGETISSAPLNIY